MYKRKAFAFSLLIAVVSVVGLAAAGIGSPPAHARVPASGEDYEACNACHENLYYLHDTGKWFCIEESPMDCTCCHGGNPHALKKEEAHAGLTEYPIIDGDISRCQHCHPGQASQRAAKFDRVAGISDVLVAPSYQPAQVHDAGQVATIAPGAQSAEFPVRVSAVAIIAIALIIGFALALYALFRPRPHNPGEGKE